jgi:hypothetical protein
MEKIVNPMKKANFPAPSNWARVIASHGYASWSKRAGVPRRAAVTEPRMMRVMMRVLIRRSTSAIAIHARSSGPSARGTRAPRTASGTPAPHMTRGAIRWPRHQLTAPRRRNTPPTVSPNFRSARGEASRIRRSCR